MSRQSRRSEGSLRRGPTYRREARENSRGFAPVAGIDEAGRGPWAGPVVAAAVILDRRSVPKGLDDSKMLEPEARETLYTAIMASGACIGVGIADVERIDAMNILGATLWAMAQAVARLETAPRL